MKSIRRGPVDAFERSKNLLKFQSVNIPPVHTGLQRTQNSKEIREGEEFPSSQVTYISPLAFPQRIAKYLHHKILELQSFKALWIFQF